MESYYDILRIKPNAKPEEVKKAYFVLAKKYHPDAGDTTEVGKFHEVAKAYKILSDPGTRKIYDLSLGVTAAEAKKSAVETARQNTATGARPTERDDELKEFHKNRYQSAVFRVFFASILVGMVGGVLATILGGLWLVGAVFGVLIGFSYSINQNFQVRSFFSSDKKHKLFRLLSWFLFLSGLIYFAWLIVRGLF